MRCHIILFRFLTGPDFNIWWAWHVSLHKDVMALEHFPQYWPFVREVPPMADGLPHKGLIMWIPVFQVLIAWTSCWINGEVISNFWRHAPWIIMSSAPTDFMTCDNGSLFTTRKDFNYLSHLSVNKCWNMQFSTQSANRMFNKSIPHYNGVIMAAIASQITSLTIVFSAVYLDTDRRKHLSSASLVTGEFPAQMASNAENVSIWYHVSSYVVLSSCERLPNKLPYKQSLAVNTRIGTLFPLDLPSTLHQLLWTPSWLPLEKQFIQYVCLHIMYY